MFLVVLSTLLSSFDGIYIYMLIKSNYITCHVIYIFHSHGSFTIHIYRWNPVIAIEICVIRNFSEILNFFGGIFSNNAYNNLVSLPYLFVAPVIFPCLLVFFLFLFFLFRQNRRISDIGHGYDLDYIYCS